MSVTADGDAVTPSRNGAVTEEAQVEAPPRARFTAVRRLRAWLFTPADHPQVLDVRGAVRDTFLAGGYTAATTGAILRSPKAAALGFGGGGFLGSVLHVAPREFESGSRLSRVAIRAASGIVAGAGSGSTYTQLLLDDKSPESMRRAMVRGAIAGGLFYALWALIEPRLEHPATPTMDDPDPDAQTER